MKKELETGIRGYAEDEVTEDKTAIKMSSGNLPVYATPGMAAMMEYTAWTSVEPYLEEGKGTVGTRLDISHLAATGIGGHVRYESELIEIDRRRLVFDIKAYDDAGLIGEGRHERFIIDNERFLAKAAGRIAESKQEH